MTDLHIRWTDQLVIALVDNAGEVEHFNIPRKVWHPSRGFGELKGARYFPNGWVVCYLVVYKGDARVVEEHGWNYLVGN